jgi:Rieske 2Fe-2S family protein
MNATPVFNVDRIARLLAARQPGHSLPQAFYSDPEIFEFDLAAIYGTSWLMAGFEIELPRRNSSLSLMIGRWPVLITRDRDGQLHAFHNSCRHRGAQICPPGRGTGLRLVCPYHRWTYDLDGSLAHAARMPDDFDRTEHGLRPIRLEAMAGVIYICLGDDPPDFAPFRAAFEPLLAPHDLLNAKVAFESVLVDKANWKLVMENGRECYHCAMSHPELSKTFPVEASKHFDYGDDAARVAAFDARLAAVGLGVGPVEGPWWQAARFPLNPGHVSMTMDGRHAVGKFMCTAGDGDIGSLRWALEPHSFSHATADFTFMFSALPVAPQETHVVAKWLVHKDAVEGVDYEVGPLAELLTRTNLQDRELAENNQRGIASPGYVPGPYSADAEALVLRFVDWYCDKAREYLDGR